MYSRIYLTIYSVDLFSLFNSLSASDDNTTSQLPSCFYIWREGVAWVLCVCAYMHVCVQPMIQSYIITCTILLILCSYTISAVSKMLTSGGNQKQCKQTNHKCILISGLCRNVIQKLLKVCTSHLLKYINCNKETSTQIMKWADTKIRHTGTINYTFVR